MIKYQLLRFRFISTLLLAMSFSLLSAQEVDCGNGLDDDNDGFIDCADSECYDKSTCSTAFTCTNALFQVISQTLNKLDPLTGEYEPIGKATFNYNGAGYNVQDGYIYGLRPQSGGVHLWQINALGKETDMGKINNFSGRTYVGDFDDKGNLYTYKNGSDARLSYVDVNVLPLASTELSLKHIGSTSTPSAADITYNPKFKKFYGLSSGHELFELDHINITSKVVGDFSSTIDVKGSFGAAWSDREGNSYFANNTTGKIFRFIFNDDGTVKEVAYVATGQPTNSNDGMGCFYSLPPFETNCNDNIDNDGDGLTDCEDPDCAATGVCPSIDAKIRSIDEAGPLSIVPFHFQMINNSKEDAIGFSASTVLPEGFSFIADTLQFSYGASYTSKVQPLEGEKTSLKWSELNIPVGDTITIAFSLLVDKSIANGRYKFSFDNDGVIRSPYKLEHDILIDESIFYGAESFDCEPAFYQVYKKRGQPNTLGKLNPTTAEYDHIAVIDHQANGLGHDINSGYAYGSDGKKFIRIDQHGNVSYMGFDFDKKVYVGDMDTIGNWYGKVGKDMVKVNILSNQIEQVYQGQGMPGWDMAYNTDGNFYAVHGKNVYQFDTDANTQKIIGEAGGEEVPTSGHGAQWTGLDGYHYISNNKTGKIFRIDVNTLEAVLCMQAESNLQFNDGFACPDELPVVFQYDFGDNSFFPIARHLVYDQDLGSDDVPDYAMVWLGDGVTHELLDPSNSVATGDLKDDGLKIIDDVQNDNVVSAELTLSANRDNMNAYWGIWIDWDFDGQHDKFYSGNEILSGTSALPINFEIPDGQDADKFAVRVRTSGVILKESNFGGDINEPGEVEDYILSANLEEICDNGIDDDNDGLLDCDDTECVKECDYGKSGSAGEGGLESNDNLIQKITTTLFDRKRDGKKSNQNKQEMATFGKSISAATFDLKSLIPVDVIEKSDTKISSPEHLINLTNAVDLFSVDIFQGDDRVAAILSLETEKGVYEHTKYICDRLTGSKVLDIYEYKIDKVNNFLITKLELPNGDIEYSCSFSIHKTKSGNTSLESHWNLEDYSKDVSFFNFQIWANNTKYLVDLCNEIIRLTNVHASITEFKIGKAPQLYIKTGYMENGYLILDIVNKSRVDYIDAAGTFSTTETTAVKPFKENIPLSGKLNETVKIRIGDVYYLGLAFHHPEIDVEDVIFMANGAWGYSFDNKTEAIGEYNVNPTNHQHDKRYDVQRSVSVSGKVKHYISFYRSFEPRFKKKDLDAYNSVSFRAKGNATLEIAVMKEGITQWSDQAKMKIELTSDEREYTLGKAFFKDISGQIKTWEDANMIVINVLGNNKEAQAFEMKITDIFFGHKQEESPYIVYTDKNMIGPKDIEHTASTMDGTDIGKIEIGKADTSVVINVKNISSNTFIVDDIEIKGGNGAFDITGFEPTKVDGGDDLSFKVVYSSNINRKPSNGQIYLHIETKEGYKTITFNVAATAICADQRHITNNDLINARIDEQIAKRLITTDAIIESKSSTSFAAGQEIILEKGFEVKAGGQIELLINDKCPSEEK